MSHKPFKLVPVSEVKAGWLVKAPDQHPGWESVLVGIVAPEPDGRYVRFSAAGENPTVVRLLTSGHVLAAEPEADQ